jgi:gamma-glutamyltranspeptidase/glutathione hydrolase
MTEDLGFFYNNFLGHLNPCQGSPDSITPGARIGSLCPAIWTQNGSLRLALGSPGGSRLTTSTLQTVLNHLWFGFSIQTAVSLPRFHAEEKNLLHMESALRTREGIALSGLGYTLLDSTYVGRVQAIARLGQDLIPGADPRGGMGVQIV